MIAFLLIPIAALVILYLNVSKVLRGRAGKLLALGFLLCIFLGMFFRDTVAGAALLTFSTVWMAQALWIFVLLDIFLIVRFFVLSRKMTRAEYHQASSKFIPKSSRVAFLTSIALTLIFIGVGVPHNQRYYIRELSYGNPDSEVAFTAVYFSDMHFDPLFQESKLERFASEVDSLKPDYVLFGGDLSDVPTTTMDEWGYGPSMAGIAKGAKVAAIAINGNHEAMQERNGSNSMEWLHKNGWIVLDDSSACFESACFTGRTDFQVARTRELERKPLQDMVPTRTDVPWILLDHQPKGIEEGYTGRLPDFALSGHTHDGQFFPVTALIGLFWQLAYGEGELNGVPWLVSSGIDSWGPPVRIGSDTEMWVIKFHK